MNQDLDLNRIQLFREVVLAGSFSKAASRLRMPKSRVSRHIAQLEKDLGVPLIYRTTRQFRLTQTGTDLFQKTSPILCDLKSALDQVTSSSEEIAGPISLTVPEDIGCELMAQICHDFLALYPKVELNLHASNQVMDLIKNSFDIALRIGPARDSSMIRRKIGHVGLILTASPEFVERHGPITRLEQLEKLPYLSFAPLAGRKPSLRMTNGQSTQTLKLTAQFSCNNFFVLRGMAMLGSAFTPLPAFLAREAIKNGALVHLVKEWVVESSPVQILIPQQKEVPPRIRAFVDYLSTRLGPAL